MQALTATHTRPSDPLAGRMLAYACALGLLFLSFAAALIAAGYGVDSPWAVAVLAGAAAVAERGRVRLERESATESSISNLPVLFTAVVLGPLPAAIVGAASMLGAVRRPYMKVATYTLSRGIAGALTGLVAIRAEGLVANDVGAVAVAIALGGLTLEIVDLGFVC